MWGPISRKSCFFAAAVLLAFRAYSPSANASSIYYELNGGLGQIRNGEGLLGTGVPATSDFGFQFNFTFAFTLFESSRFFDVHFGMQNHFTMTSAGDTHYSMIVPYPMIRLQILMLYAGVGFTPLAWVRTSPEAGFSDFQKASINYASMAEVGTLWALTPRFSLGLSLGRQTMKSGDVTSPNPVFETMVVMRYYLDFFKGPFGGSSESGEFRGWRYPFGHQIEN